MESLIRVRNVTKTYGEGESQVRALLATDLDIHAGEITAMVGPSGSGKTTLLSIMGCILRPSSGEIRVAGLEVTNLSESQLPCVRLEHIGFVFQGFNLFPTLTAGENVALMLELKGIRKPKARKCALELLDAVGLGAKSNTFPADLSGGQKQRVAIARALAGDPKIILADEPTASLDSQSGHAIMQILRNLAHERGRAVVIVTHDPRIVEFTDRQIRIQDGMITGNSSSLMTETPLRASTERSFQPS